MTDSSPTRVTVERLSEEEARQIQHRAEEAMPLLRDKDWLDQQCGCSGCLETALAEEYGWDTVFKHYSRWEFVTWALGDD